MWLAGIRSGYFKRLANQLCLVPYHKEGRLMMMPALYTVLKRSSAASGLLPSDILLSGLRCLTFSYRWGQRLHFYVLIPISPTERWFFFLALFVFEVLFTWNLLNSSFGLSFLGPQTYFCKQFIAIWNFKITPKW